MIDADNWTEEQVQDFLKLQEAGLIDEKGLTGKGKALILGTLGNPPVLELSPLKEAAETAVFSFDHEITSGAKMMILLDEAEVCL